MKFPVYTKIMAVEKSGFYTSAMNDYYDLQFQALKNGLSDNGWTFPQITAANLTAISASMPDGTAWYVTTTNEIVFKVNGALRKVTTAAYP